MSIKFLFFAALTLASLGTNAFEKADTLSISNRAKFLKPVKIGPQEYFLPALAKKVTVDSALIRRQAIDERYKNRKADEITVNFYRNLQKLSGQLAPLELYTPLTLSTSPESLEALLNSTKYAGDRKTQLLVQNSLAQYYIGKGNLEKATACLQESLAIKEQVADKTGALPLVSVLAEISKLNGKYEEAISYSQTLLNANLSLKKNVPIALSYLAIASIRCLQNNFTEAENLILKKALPTFRGDKPGRLNCFEQLSDLYFLQGRYSEAKWYCLQAKNIADQLNSAESKMNSFSCLAAIKLMEGDRENALLDFKAAEQLALQNNYADRLMEIKGEIGEIYRKMGNYVLAGTFINEYSLLSKNVLKANR